MSYFKPINYTKLNDIPKYHIEISDELHSKIENMKYENGDKRKPNGDDSTQWIYLEDCLSRGTIKPIEAYDILKLGYVPEHLSYRKSIYSKL